MITNPNVKINLGLNILRKREDGFHDLETLFVPYFGISDTLEIVVGDDYSRTSAALFAKYGTQVPASQGSVKPEGIFGVETEDSDAPKIAQGISEDGKLMITIARAEGVDWDPLKDLTAKAYYILAEDFNLPPVKIFLEKTSPVGAGLGGGSADAADPAGWQRGQDDGALCVDDDRAGWRRRRALVLQVQGWRQEERQAGRRLRI